MFSSTNTNFLLYGRENVRRICAVQLFAGKLIFLVVHVKNDPVARRENLATDSKQKWGMVVQAVRLSQ
jgi:hypothetical protein